MNIALIGYGKMGKAIEKIAEERGHKIVLICNSELSVKYADFENVELAIEFTEPNLAVGHIEFCIDKNIPIVVGTTGWYDELDEVIEKVNNNNGSLLHATNFSIGVNIFFEINKKLAQLLQHFLKSDNFNQLNNYHDWLIYAYARSNSFKWCVDSYSGVEYRQHTANFFGANVGIKAFISRVQRVLNGEGFDFSFSLMKELNVQDPFIQSLFPVSRINLLRLAFKFKHCRRRWRDQIYFFFACISLVIIFPKKLRAI